MNKKKVIDITENGLKDFQICLKDFMLKMIKYFIILLIN